MPPRALWIFLHILFGSAVLSLKAEDKATPAKNTEEARLQARENARAAAEAARLEVDAKAPEELPALLGHPRFRIRELAQRRLLDLLENDPEKAAELCHKAYTGESDPEIRMRAKEVLLAYVTRAKQGGTRGFVGIGLLLHAFFDKQGNLQFAVKVSQVINGTPAEKAGLKAGDIITGVDDVALDGKDADQRFMDIVGGKGAGNKVVLKFRRDEEEKAAEVVLAARPENLAENRPPVDREQLLRDWLREKQAATTPAAAAP